MKNRHSTDRERLEIEGTLRPCVSIHAFAEQLGNHHSILSREIPARRIDRDKGAFGRLSPPRCVRTGAALPILDAMISSLVKGDSPYTAFSPTIPTGFQAEIPEFRKRHGDSREISPLAHSMAAVKRGCAPLSMERCILSCGPWGI